MHLAFQEILTLMRKKIGEAWNQEILTLMRMKIGEAWNQEIAAVELNYLSGKEEVGKEKWSYDGAAFFFLSSLITVFYCTYRVQTAGLF